MTDHESIAYHARRLLVAPPRDLRERMGRTHRIVRLLRDLMQYGFAIVYALLAAQLVLMLVPGTTSRILLKMLAPAVLPLTNPFKDLLPEYTFLGELNALVPVALAFPAYTLLQYGISQVLRLAGRPRLARSSASPRSSLFQSVVQEDGTMQVARVRNQEPHMYRMGQ